MVHCDKHSEFMETFDDFKLKKQLKNAIADLGFVAPTPVQEQSFSIIKAGNDILGIAQTGTGKTLAYCLPILEVVLSRDF